MVYFICNELASHRAVKISFRRLYKIFQRAGLDCDFNTTTCISEGHTLFDLILLREKLNTNDLIVTPTLFSTLFSKVLFCFKKVKVVYWIQGDIAEEVYLRSNSKTKKVIIRFLDNIALYVSNYHIYVSDYMREYYAKRISREYLVLPCISTLKYDGSKKESGSYCYIGGLSAWQKIDWVLAYMEKLIMSDHNTKFYLATKDIEKANILLKQYNISENTIVCSLDSEQEVEAFLSTKKYGFLLREDSIVNNVSSPIKLAEYLSCGISVLISPSITSYATMIEEQQCGRIVRNINEPLDVSALCMPPTLKLFESNFSIESACGVVKDKFGEYKGNKS
jgi:hypothetical protein